MIRVTRLNGHAFVVNAELIKMIEAKPDTAILLINGDRILVRESVDEVVKRAVEYGRSVRTFAT
jgi:flagellar protein FlbD